MAKPVRKQRSLAMYEAIIRLQTVDECCAFFDDLCAITELRALEQRFDVATLLCQGKVYTDIMAQTNASSATISRVNRIVNYGTGQMTETINEMLADNPEQDPSAQESEK